MKILMLTYEVANRGGNYIRSYSLAKELVKLGHSVTLLASNNLKTLHDKNYISEGVQIIEIGCILPYRLRHNGTSPFQILNRIKHIYQNSYDLVHGFGHRPTVLIPSLYFRYKYKKPYVADWSDLWGWGGLASHRGKIRGRLTGQFDDSLEKTTYRLANAVTAISDHLIKKTKKINQKNIFKVEVGCDIQEIIPKNKTIMRQKYNLPIKQSVVVFLGNAPYDSLFLANSFIELNKLNPKVICLFIGAHMPDFDIQIKKNNLSNHIIHKGFVPHNQIGELLACGDVMLLPYSNRELNLGRYPNKIGDYMAAGRPTVANPTGEIKKLFLKEKIGLLAPESPKKFAMTIQKLLLNPRLKNKLGNNARLIAENKISWMSLAKKLEKNYQEILA